MAEKNYITTLGYQALVDEQMELVMKERPRICAEVSEAAGNGDRSENSAYIYGKRRLREIDRRLGFLQRRIDQAEVVNVAEQGKGKKAAKIFFGATVELEDEDDGRTFTYQIVGVDEIDLRRGKISWKSPLGRALLGKEVDDTVIIRFDAHGEAAKRKLTVLDLRYE
jgi:transcription elongation factor GreB